MLGIAAVPVLLFVGAKVYGTVTWAQDEQGWRSMRAEAVADYEETTLQQVRNAGSTWTFTYGTWILPLPDGMEVMTTEAVGEEGDVVLVSIDLTSERCLRLVFDEDGLIDDEEISCRTLRITGGSRRG